MNDKTNLNELARQLADKIAGIRPAILDSNLFGQTNAAQIQQDLRHSASQLVHGINSGWERTAVSGQLGKLEGQLQTAAAIGLLADVDLQRYLGMIDDIYTALDQEN